MSVEVQQSDRDAALAMRQIVAAQLRRVGISITVKPPADDSEEVQAFAAHRHQAEEAIIRAADKWLATQYGLRPLSADLAAIRSIDTRGE